MQSGIQGLAAELISPASIELLCLSSFIWRGEKDDWCNSPYSKRGKISDRAWQPAEDGFTVSSSEDGGQSPEGKEELKMEETHEVEGYKEVFHIPAPKGEYSEAALR